MRYHKRRINIPTPQNRNLAANAFFDERLQTEDRDEYYVNRQVSNNIQHHSPPQPPCLLYLNAWLFRVCACPLCAAYIVCIFEGLVGFICNSPRS